MKVKKDYLEAEIDIVLIQSADIITTSTIGDGELDKDGWA